MWKRLVDQVLRSWLLWDGAFMGWMTGSERRVGSIRFSASLTLSLAMAIGALTAVTLPAPKALPGGLHSPVLAIELVRSSADVEQVVGDHLDPRRRAMRTINLVDFAFIAAYTTLFIVVSTTLTPRERPWGDVRRFGGALLGTMTGLFDVVENILILDILTAPITSVGETEARALHHVALAKWMLSFATLGFLAPLFFGRPRPAIFIAPTFLGTALVGLFGVFDLRLIEAATLPMIVGLWILAYVSWRHPRSLSSA